MTKLEYQLEILKLEIETINSTIRQMDTMTERIKNWTIVIWAAALGTTITTENLNRYIALTAVIPIVFWFVDGWYRRIQSRFIWRTIQISQFLNDERLTKSFERQELVEFKLFDPASRLSKGNPEYESFIKMSRTMRFGSLSLFYSLLGVCRNKTATAREKRIIV